MTDIDYEQDERFTGVRRVAEMVNAYGATIRYESKEHHAEMVAEFARQLLTFVFITPGPALSMFDYAAFIENTRREQDEEKLRLNERRQRASLIDQMQADGRMYKPPTRRKKAV